MPTGPLITAEALMSGASQPVLLDVRWTLRGPDRAAYEEGHLPGAVFCDLDADLATTPGEGGRHPLPSADALTATMRRLGIGGDRDVVVYDGGNGSPAARAWWVLSWAGHEHVRVLDGGLPAWVAAGGAVEPGPVVSVPAPEAVARPGARPVVEAAEIAARAAGILVDLRAPERYRGEAEPVDPVAGHIPGAVSVPVTVLRGPDGCYLPAPALRDLLAPLTADGTPVAYCGSGVTASELVLAGAVAGVDVALYPGSWSDWIRDPSHPVATGPLPG